MHGRTRCMRGFVCVCAAVRLCSYARLSIPDIDQFLLPYSNTTDPKYYGTLMMDA